MKQIEIKVGFSCNNLCVFCIQGNRREWEPELSLKEIKDKLKQGRDDGIISVVLTGGEPTFRPEILLGCVKFAKSIGYETIEIQSNGTSFDSKEYCKDLIGAGANKFSISIHGSSAEEHDALTQSPGSWDKATTGIKNLKKMNSYIKTNSVITKSNYKSFPELTSLLIGLGVIEIQLSFINPVALNDDEKVIRSLVPKVSQVASYIKKSVQLAADAGVNIKVAAMPYCVMGRYRDYIASETVPVPHEFIERLEIRNYGEPIEIEGKYKKSECIKCRHFESCDGLWSKYVDFFGSDEISPVL